MLGSAKFKSSSQEFWVCRRFDNFMFVYYNMD